jgi:isopenicillin-N N-acyltransferase like protein
MMRELATLPVLTLEGAPADMGIEYGKTMSSLISTNLDDYLKRFRDVAHLSDADVRRWGEVYRKATHQYKASIGEMLEGVAAGSGHSPAHIFALNARTEILYSAQDRDDGCTSLALLPSHTSSHHTLIGQNWDWHPEQRSVMLLLATREPDGFTVFTLAEAGMLAKTGLNSNGLGLCANLLVSDRDRGGDGVPYHILLRGVLESRTMADAIRRAVGYPRVSSGNFLLADAGGEAIDLEAVPGDFGYLLPQQGLIAHSNHFLTNVPVFDRRKAFSALTLLRPERARHLLADVLDARKVALDDLRAVFRDHYSYPNGICRHVDDRDAPYDRVCSVFSIVMDLDTREFSIAEGPPCEHDYVSVSLDALFRKEAAGQRSY